MQITISSFVKDRGSNLRSNVRTMAPLVRCDFRLTLKFARTNDQYRSLHTMWHYLLTCLYIYNRNGRDFRIIRESLSHACNLLQHITLNKWLVSIFRDTSRAELNERSTSWDDAIASASGITRREQVSNGSWLRHPHGWHTDYRTKFVKRFAPRCYCSC